jgi:hypothetical protein
VRGPDQALTLIDHGLAIADETGEHLPDPFLHALRGDVLPRRNPADPTLPRKPSRLRSASRRNKGRAATACLRGSRSPSFTNRPAAQSKRTPSSRLRSRASRRRRKCQRSPRRRDCWQRLLDSPTREGFGARPIAALRTRVSSWKSRRTALGGILAKCGRSLESRTPRRPQAICYVRSTSILLKNPLANEGEL